MSTENLLQDFEGVTPYQSDDEVEGIAFNTGDTLLANIRPYLKKAWYAAFDGTCSADVLAFSPKRISPAFLYNIIARDCFIEYVMSGVKGSKMPRGDKTHILEYEFAIPEKDEQEKIATFIALADCKIAKQRKMIAALKKYKRGVTAKLITAIEEKYPVVKLGNYVAVMRGGSPRPIDAYITNAENGIRWIKIGDAQPDQLYISDTKEKIKPEGAKKSRRVYAGDLILSNSMSFGRPYILKVDGCIHDGWLLIRDEGKKVDKRFLCFYLASDATLAQYKKYAAGSCVNNLNSELVASVEIGMPPIEQQIRVANILEKIDRQVEAASTMYSLLSKLRSFLLQQLFI